MGHRNDAILVLSSTCEFGDHRMSFVPVNGLNPSSCRDTLDEINEKASCSKM